MLLAQREARNRQLDIIGIYHSTPTPVRFHLNLIECVLGINLVYPHIVQNGKAYLKSWSLDDHRCFQPVNCYRQLFRKLAL